MTSPYDTFKTAVLGTPYNPNLRPSRQGTVRAFAEMQKQLEAAQAGALIFANKAQLLASGAVPSARIMAWVTNDPVKTDNGIYSNAGTAGSPSWTRMADIPQFLVTAMNDGDGSANAIIAETDLPIPTQDGRALIVFNVLVNNTGPATIALNGGTALSIVTNSGATLAADALVAGMYIAGFVSDSGTKFRMLSDPVSHADRVAAEAARVAAEAARDEAQDAASSTRVNFGTRDLAEAADVGESVQYLHVSGRSVFGIGRSSYIKLGSPPVPEKSWHFETADSKWFELQEIVLNSDIFNAPRNGVGYVDQHIQEMFAYADAIGGALCRLPSGLYVFDTPVDIPNNVTLDLRHGAKIQTDGDLNMFAFRANGSIDEASAKPLNANIGRGNDYVPLSPSDGDTFAPGDYVIVRQNRFVVGSSGQQHQRTRVVEVSNGTVSLLDPLMTAYLTADGAELVKYTPRKNVNILGGEIDIGYSSFRRQIATITLDSNVIVMNDIADIAVGMYVHNAKFNNTRYFKDYSQITGISGSGPYNVEMDKTANANGSNVTTTFGFDKGGGIQFDLTEGCGLIRTKVRYPSNRAAIVVNRSDDFSERDTRVSQGQHVASGGYGYGHDVSNYNKGALLEAPASRQVRENAISVGSREIRVRSFRSYADYGNAWNTHAADDFGVDFEDGYIEATQFGTALAFSYLTGYQYADTNLNADKIRFKNLLKGAFQAFGAQTGQPVLYRPVSVSLTNFDIDGYGLSSTGNDGIYCYRIDDLHSKGHIIRGGTSNTGTTAEKYIECTGAKVGDSTIDGVTGTAIQFSSNTNSELNNTRMLNVTGTYVNTGIGNTNSKITNCEIPSGATEPTITATYQRNNSWKGRQQSGKATVSIAAGAPEGSVTVIFPFAMPNTSYPILLTVLRAESTVIGSPRYSGVSTTQMVITVYRNVTTNAADYEVSWQIG